MVVFLVFQKNCRRISLLCSRGLSSLHWHAAVASLTEANQHGSASLGNYGPSPWVCPISGPAYLRHIMDLFQMR